MTAAAAAAVLVLIVMLAGVYALAALQELATTSTSAPRARLRRAVATPAARAASLLLQQVASTEHPDGPAWRLAPALYLGLAAGALALIPASPTAIAVDSDVGIVLWGAIEALVLVAVFLHGWSANSLFPLLGAYRFVALGLSILLVSMFVLIAAALPAESMRLAAIVESQREMWNVVRQPLGLPLLLCVGMALASFGPLCFADSDDLASGTASELSGAPLLVWTTARASILVAFAALAATLFLGGWLPPWPAWLGESRHFAAPLWLGVKTLAVLAILVAIRGLTGRVATRRMVAWVWTVLLPLSFVHLALAGIEALA